jgi:hypothetical protein
MRHSGTTCSMMCSSINSSVWVCLTGNRELLFKWRIQAVPVTHLEDPSLVHKQLIVLAPFPDQPAHGTSLCCLVLYVVYTFGRHCNLFSQRSRPSKLSRPPNQLFMCMSCDHNSLQDFQVSQHYFMPSNDRMSSNSELGPHLSQPIPLLFLCPHKPVPNYPTKLVPKHFLELLLHHSIKANNVALYLICLIRCYSVLQFQVSEQHMNYPFSTFLHQHKRQDSFPSCLPRTNWNTSQVQARLESKNH